MRWFRGNETPSSGCGSPTGILGGKVVDDPGPHGESLPLLAMSLGLLVRTHGLLLLIPNITCGTSAMTLTTVTEQGSVVAVGVPELGSVVRVPELGSVVGVSRPCLLCVVSEGT